jgi:hypothetical protein
VRGAFQAAPLLPRLNTAAAVAVALLLLAVVLEPWVRPGEDRRTRPRWVFITLVVAVVLLWRWPTFALFELNPDESEDIAAALTLRHDPRYWSSVAGTTHGPFVSFPLLVPCALAMVPEYGSARLAGLGLLLGALLALYGALRRWFSEDVARLLITPAAFCLAFIRYWDYVAYNGEHAVVFLASVAGWQTRRALAPGARLRQVFVAGLLLGCVPYAKLQGIPLAAAIAALYLAALLRQKDLRPRVLAAFLGGATAPSALVVVYVAALGLLPYFRASYFSWNLGYANRATSSAWEGLLELRSWLYDQRWNETFAPFLLASIVVGAAIAASRATRRRLPPLATALVVVGATAYAVFRPGYPAQHYLLLLLFPLVLLNGALWGPGLEGRGRRTAAAAFAVINLGAPLAMTLPQVSREAATAPLVAPPQGLASARRIRQHTAPGDGLLVWGWAERYYVLTQTWRATRSVPRAPIESGRLQPYFYRLLLEDFDRADPPVFVDAVGPGQFYYWDRNRHGHELFPELRERVRQRYRLVADVDGARIYVRTGGRPQEAEPSSPGTAQ